MTPEMAVIARSAATKQSRCEARRRASSVWFRPLAFARNQSGVGTAGAALNVELVCLELGIDHGAPMCARAGQKGGLVCGRGGKDTCMALREIHRTPELRVEALLTTITRDYDRISMHGVRRTLLEQQAESLGVPLHQILISKGAGNEEYEAKIGEAFAIYRERRIDAVVFGDLFLEEIRAYRERLLARH